MTTRRLCGVLGSFALALLHACGADSTGSDDDYVAAQTDMLDLSLACNDKPADVYTRPNNFGNSGSQGDIVRCAKGRKLSAAEINQKLNSFSTPFRGAAAKYAVQLYTISYRTTRLNNQPDLATALVLLPVLNGGGKNNAATDATATTVAPDATTTAKPAPPIMGGDDPEPSDDDTDDAFEAKNINSLPLVMFAHGTAPWGNACAASRIDPTQSADADEESGVEIALAGRGFPVIAPDYAGYVQGSKAPGYLLSPDEAHSVLDATRAFPKLVKSAPSKVVFVGHSQGGHAVLSAQALVNSYGMSGKLTGVAAFAPFWAPARTLGAIIAPGSPYTVQDTPDVIKFAIEYFYTHAEVYDGPGTGAALFVQTSAVQNALQQLTNSCSFSTEPSSDFGTTPDTFFEMNFDQSVGFCGAEKDACNDEGGLATIWESRFQADRPALNQSGAPIVLWQGKADLTIFPQLAKCGIDKIRSDLPSSASAKFTFCGDKKADHQTILSRRTAWVIKWIKARVFGSSEPSICKGEEAITDSGTTLTCFEPPEPVNVD